MWQDNPWYACRVEELPIEFVKQFIGNSLRKTPEQMRIMEQDIVLNGFEHPVTLTVGRYDKVVYLGEGNHRLEIAERMGIPTIPTMVGLRKKAGRPVSGYDPVIYPFLSPNIEDQYFISYKPSEIFTRFEIVAKRIKRRYVRMI